MDTRHAIGVDTSRSFLPPLPRFLPPPLISLRSPFYPSLLDESIPLFADYPVAAPVNLARRTLPSAPPPAPPRCNFDRYLVLLLARVARKSTAILGKSRVPQFLFSIEPRFFLSQL